MVMVSISAKWLATCAKRMAIRRMPRTADASACSGTRGLAKRSRTVTSSRSASLNQSSSIWWMVMNITSSLASEASSGSRPPWSESRSSTRM